MNATKILVSILIIIGVFMLGFGVYIASRPIPSTGDTMSVPPTSSSLVVASQIQPFVAQLLYPRKERGYFSLNDIPKTFDDNGGEIDVAAEPKYKCLGY